MHTHALHCEHTTAGAWFKTSRRCTYVFLDFPHVELVWHLANSRQDHPRVLVHVREQQCLAEQGLVMQPRTAITMAAGAHLEEEGAVHPVHTSTQAHKHPSTQARSTQHTAAVSIRMPCGHAAVAGFGNTGAPARSAHNVYTWPAGCAPRPLALPWPQHANAVATYRSSSVPNTRVKCSAMATAAVNCDQATTQRLHNQTLSTSFSGDTPLETTPATQVRCGQALRLLACGGVARGSISGDDQLRHEKLGGLTLDHQIAPSDRGYCFNARTPT